MTAAKETVWYENLCLIPQAWATAWSGKIMEVKILGKWNDNFCFSLFEWKEVGCLHSLAVSFQKFSFDPCVPFVFQLV